jgi:hypothetical protein
MVKEETKQPQDEVPRIEYIPPSSFSTDMQVWELLHRSLGFYPGLRYQLWACAAFSAPSSGILEYLPFSVIPLRSMRTDRTSL